MTALETPTQVTSNQATPRRTPRRIRSFRVDDWWSLIGSLVSAVSLVWIGYFHLLALSGTLGFMVCVYIAFIVIYGTVTAVGNPTSIVVDRVVAASVTVAAAIVLLALASTVIFTFVKGWSALDHLNFFTRDMAGVSPTAPLSQGGMLHALVGTVIEVGMAVAVSVPLGIATAVYMTEIGGRGSQLVRTVVESMTALPEILAGLFVYVALIVYVGLPKSGLAASIAMAVTMVPIIARAGEVALRVVPGGLREASSALGASHWKTVWKVVLPTARAGLATATILAIARGIGETAVVLITSGASSFLTFNPTSEPMNSLPLYIYAAYTTHEPLALARAFGAASVLLTLVVVLFAATRWLLRDKAARR